MANNQRRMIYVKLWESEQFGRLSDQAKLLYIGMITIADDDGRLHGNPSYLRGQIFPFDEKMSVTDALLLRTEIEKSGLITIYSMDNCEYIEHPKWEEYQHIRKDLYKKSTLPFRNGSVTVPLQKRDTRQVKTSKDKLSIANGEKSPSAPINPLFELFESVNPSYRELYKNKTQRSALERMVKTHGEDPVKHWIGIICKTNGMPYAPVITTPFEMEKKLGDLKAFITREKSKQQ